MLAPQDIADFKLDKAAFAQEPTVNDFMNAIRADMGLSASEQLSAVSKLRQAIGSSPVNTPISALQAKGIGGILGYLIGKYFGLGFAGHAIGAAVGYGVGGRIHDRLMAPGPKYPGYKKIGY